MEYTASTGIAGITAAAQGISVGAFPPPQMDERVDTVLELLGAEKSGTCDPAELAGLLGEAARGYRSEAARTEEEMREAVEEIYRKYEHG